MADVSAAERLRALQEIGSYHVAQEMDVADLALWAADVAERLYPLRSHPLAAKALERLEEIVP